MDKMTWLAANKPGHRCAGPDSLSPYYCSFARSLSLHGNEQVLDFGSGSCICPRHIAARLQSWRASNYVICRTALSHLT
jgi:hypothetical protein